MRGVVSAAGAPNEPPRRATGSARRFRLVGPEETAPAPETPLDPGTPPDPQTLTDPGTLPDDETPTDPAPSPDPEPVASWPRLITSTLARGVLATVLSLCLWAAVPALFGWHPTTVMTGSMMPRVQVGDVAVSRPLNGHAPTLGSVLLFDDPDHPGRLRFHRFVAVSRTGSLITRGDANPADDSTPISLAVVRGVGTLRVPYIGTPIVWIRTGQWLDAALVVVGLAVLIGLAGLGAYRGGGRGRDDEDGPPDAAAEDNDDKAEDQAAESETGSKPGRSDLFGTAPGPRSRALLAVLLAGLLVTSGSVAVATTGANFSRTTSTTASLGAQAYFTCSASVLASTPYLFYRMDETTPTTNTAAADSSGNSHPGVYGTAGETPKATRACTRDTGYAMTFDGSSGYLSSPLYNAAAPNTFTLSIWFKTTTVKGGKLIGWGNAQTGTSGTYDRHVYLTNTGAVIFGVYPGAVKTISSAAGFNDGGWHQAVATLSTAGMVLYLDGNQVATDTTVTSGEGANSGYWRIGFDNISGWTNSPTSNYFAGTLDDAAVYLTALNATAVKNLYLSGT